MMLRRVSYRILRLSAAMSRSSGNEASSPVTAFSPSLLAQQRYMSQNQGQYRKIGAVNAKMQNSVESINGERAIAVEREHEEFSLYEMLVRRLYQINLFHPVKLGLSNIERLHKAMGSPMDKDNLIIIHIAGTNGKGSVAIKIAKTLELAGYNTGLFVSPHISSFRERIQINSHCISETDVVKHLPIIFETCEHESIPATFFEVTTALAFAYYTQHNVDVVVLETGLGGRLDSTNVVQNPALSIITSIGLEHTRILGNTIELIALEKAGIIKHMCPVLVGPNVPHDVIRAVAEERHSEYLVSDNVLPKLPPPPLLSNGIVGNSDAIFVDYDIENARIAEAAIKVLHERGRIKEISSKTIIEGISHRPPCRFETVRCTVGSKVVQTILDVAHNPVALKFLMKKLDSLYPNQRRRFIVGFSSDKDLKQCAELLLASVRGSDPKQIHLVQAAHPRAATIEQLVKACPTLSGSQGADDGMSISIQVQRGLKLAAERDELLVICGSVFIMAEIREGLGFDEPRDSNCISEVAGASVRHGQENFADNRRTEFVFSKMD